MLPQPGCCRLLHETSGFRKNHLMQRSSSRQDFIANVLHISLLESCAVKSTTKYLKFIFTFSERVL